MQLRLILSRGEAPESKSHVGKDIPEAIEADKPVDA